MMLRKDSSMVLTRFVYLKPYKNATIIKVIVKNLSHCVVISIDVKIENKNINIL